MPWDRREGALGIRSVVDLVVFEDSSQRKNAISGTCSGVLVTRDHYCSKKF